MAIRTRFIAWPSCVHGSLSIPARHLPAPSRPAARAHGESYIAGGVALGLALETQRLSRDLGVFHDTSEAVARSWDRDRELLERSGYTSAEIGALAFDGPPPDVRDLSMRWQAAVERAIAVIDRLPAAHVGEAVISEDGRLFSGSPIVLARLVAQPRRCAPISLAHAQQTLEGVLVDP